MKAPLAKYLADTYSFRFMDEQVDVLMERIHEAKTGALDCGNRSALLPRRA